MSQSTAHELNKAARFVPGTHPVVEIAEVAVAVYVEDDGDGLRLRISAHFDAEVDELLLDESGTVRTTVTFNGEPQDTYDRSTGAKTTN